MKKKIWWEREWIKELKDENSCTQEYLATIVEVYYGLWAGWKGTGGMWGIHKSKNRKELKKDDPLGWQVLQSFFPEKVNSPIHTIGKIHYQRYACKSLDEGIRKRNTFI